MNACVFAQAQMHRAFAQQLVQRQAAEMHAQLSQAPQALHGQPSLGIWVNVSLLAQTVYTCLEAYTD